MNLVISFLLFLSGSAQQPPVDLENVPLPVSKCLQASDKTVEISRRIPSICVQISMVMGGQILSSWFKSKSRRRRGSLSALPAV